MESFIKKSQAENPNLVENEYWAVSMNHVLLLQSPKMLYLRVKAYQAVYIAKEV
jgi:hypothetical protein